MALFPSTKIQFSCIVSAVVTFSVGFFRQPFVFLSYLRCLEKQQRLAQKVGLVSAVLVMSNIMLAYFNSLIKYQKKRAEFANIVDLDEIAYNEPPHQDLHCLPSSL